MRLLGTMPPGNAAPLSGSNKDQRSQLPRYRHHDVPAKRRKARGRAQQMAGHESARTTGLYDRRNDSVAVDEVERIAY